MSTKRCVCVNTDLLIFHVVRVGSGSNTDTPLGAWVVSLNRHPQPEGDGILLTDILFAANGLELVNDVRKLGLGIRSHHTHCGI